MGLKGTSVYSRIVMHGLKKDLGHSYTRQVKGCINRDQNNILNKRGQNEDVRTDEAWEYFFNNYSQGKYQPIMKELKRNGFRYPFGLDSPDDPDTSLINWITSVTQGINDKLEQAKELYLRILPEINGGKSEEQGGLGAMINESSMVRPMGLKLPIETFTHKIDGHRFFICSEFSYLYAAILRNIGLNAYIVKYKKDDHKYLSSERNIMIFKEIERNLTPERAHVYVYFTAGEDRKFIADHNGVFERIERPSDHYWNDREASSHYYDQEGFIYNFRGELEKAKARLNVALEINPDLCQAHNDLGAVYKKMGRGYLADAIKEFQEAIRLNSDFANAHCNLGTVYEMQNSPENAIIEYNKAIGINPAYVVAHYNLGRVYEKMGNLEAAVNIYNEAIRMKPDFAEAHYNLALIYMKQDKLADAKKEYKEVTRIKPDDADAHNSLGAICSRLGCLVDAANEYIEAIRIKPDSADIHCNLGMVYDQLGRLEDAIIEHKKAISINPNYADAHFYLGLVYEKLGQAEEAIKEYKTAHSLKS